MNKCVFLDRDGVLNVERGDYTWELDDFVIPDSVPNAIERIKEAGFQAIVVTNQAGLSKGLYDRKQMNACHDKLQQTVGDLLDKIYYSPYHPSVTESLTRKPDTLMLEKAQAKFDIDMRASWLVGDRERDIKCGKQMGLKTILISDQKSNETQADFLASDLSSAVDLILNKH